MRQQEERELADKHGWTPVDDKRRGQGWCRFEKGQTRLWQTGPSLQWTAAELIDNHFCNHRTYKTLEEAFTKES